MISRSRLMMAIKDNLASRICDYDTGSHRLNKKLRPKKDSLECNFEQSLALAVGVLVS